MQRNLIISFLFLSQHNCFCNRLVVYKQAYDISQEDLTIPAPHPTPHHNQVAFLGKVNLLTHNCCSIFIRLNFHPPIEKNIYIFL